MLPVLRQQLLYMRDKRSALLDSILDLYNSFLEALDEASSDIEERGEGEELEKLYAVLVRRCENIETQRQYDEEGLDELLDVIEEIETNKDVEGWTMLTKELFETGEYKADTDAFKKMVDLECDALFKEAEGDFDDWAKAFSEGNIRELALLIEAIEDEYSGQPDACCSAGNDRESDGCCGRQTPCCKSSRDDTGEECVGCDECEDEEEDDEIDSPRYSDRKAQRGFGAFEEYDDLGDEDSEDDDDDIDFDDEDEEDDDEDEVTH